MSFKAANLPEQIARHVGDRIIKGEYPPGKRITEAELADELNVSRGPIREAFRILERRMLLELTPRHGARITEMSPQFVAYLYDLLRELYGLVMRKAADNHDEGELSAIRNVLKKMQTAVAEGDPEAYYEAAHEYASVCLEAAKNPLLRRVLSDFESNFRRTAFGIFTRGLDDIRKSVKPIERTTRYIERRDGEMAAKTIRSFLQTEKGFALKLVRGES